MDSLGALPIFIQAAETRSFTVAGHQLGLSASAVGKAIARLEGRLGVRLFHRSTRTITLTQEGHLFLARCRRILGEVEAAEQELADTHATPSGRLRVSLPMVGMLLMPAVNAFIQAYPEIEPDLDFSDRLVDVIGEGFDVVLRTGDAADSRLMTRIVGTFHHRLVASPAYLDCRGIPIKPADLAHHACLRHRYPTTGKLEAWPLRQDRMAGTIEPPATVVASALEPLISMAEAGLGIVSLPDFVLYEHLRTGHLVPVLSDHTEHSGVFRLLWPSSPYLSPKLRVFIEFMTANLFPPK
ncbi:LysR family transcriptional regulator [Komagataeibacter rhaeticus]|nr:LysR family transcriptional regulator [Komagataeibacter rhaeticus]KDU94498.1 LysR family transcriptional regulator [Komagataeibacter rhaeticus AF1]MBL7241011.1 LysR family transcriptional regulator [Komagataeibacter rhaeticus]PYD52411.1 LysR family transcriptional regulator [Komagataeibacter rhaeticus]GBQ14208.1 LysR family transcriptional regulator [Komagataeibacter rhaeticus DSM 16663]